MSVMTGRPVSGRGHFDLRELKVTPGRSYAQRLLALERANEVRSRRAVLKRELKAGRGSVFDLLVDPPGWLGSMRVMDLLLAVPKYGRVKVNKVLSQCKISPSKSVGGLSERQRREVVAVMRRSGDQRRRGRSGVVSARGEG